MVQIIKYLLINLKFIRNENMYSILDNEHKNGYVQFILMVSTLKLNFRKHFLCFQIVPYNHHVQNVIYVYTL